MFVAARPIRSAPARIDLDELYILWHDDAVARNATQKSVHRGKDAVTLKETDDVVLEDSRANVERLRHAGASIGESASEIARAVYIGHHLGPGDAVRFYNGRLDANRAAHLLSAQVGAEKAARHIAAASDATAAHRGWLLDYVEKFIG